MLADLVGPDSLIVIAVVIVVLLFGGTRLPKLARGRGSASHEFKKGMDEGDHDKDKSETPAPKGEDTTSGPVQSS